MAMVYAAIGNGGTLYEPHLAKAVVSSDGQSTALRRLDGGMLNHLRIAPLKAQSAQSGNIWPRLRR